MKIEIDQERCVGCGRCTEICPQTFKLNGEGKAEVVQENDLVCAGKASDACPTEAIKTEE